MAHVPPSPFKTSVTTLFEHRLCDLKGSRGPGHLGLVAHSRSTWNTDSGMHLREDKNNENLENLKTFGNIEGMRSMETLKNIETLKKNTQSLKNLGISHGDNLETRETKSII